MRTNGWFTRITRTVATVAILAGVLPLGAPAVRSSAAPFSEPVQERLARAQQSAPLIFVENVGQFDSRARFEVRSNGATIWLADDAIWITLLDQPIASTASSPSALPLSNGTDPGGLAKGRSFSGHPTAPASPTTGSNVKLSFPGANLHPRLEPLNRQTTHVSHFQGKDASRWRPDVPTWSGVRYRDLVPGLDLEVHGDGGHWTWRLAPASGSSVMPTAPDLAAIIANFRLKVDGADAVAVDRGDLQLTLAGGDLRMPLLETSTPSEPKKPALATYEGSGFTVTTPFTGYKIGTADASTVVGTTATALVYSTYLGGSGYGNSGSGIAVDRNGNAYVTGITSSSDFPTTPGAFQTTVHGIFVTKLNPSGTGLVYSTYLGGTDSDSATGIAVDGTGNAYVIGYTRSTDFPTTPDAFQAMHDAAPYEDDIFVTKINSSGTGLVYSTYLGGSSQDDGNGIAIDESDNVYVTGWTSSTDFPTSLGAYQTTLAGSYDTFVTKLNLSGTGLVYSTYLGGSFFDEGFGIAVGGSGDAYVVGQTASALFPTTPGAFQSTLGGTEDNFVSKLNPSGTALVYSTLLGGTYTDYATGLAVDGNGNAYVTGWTYSFNFPTTPCAWQTAYGGGIADAFVTKLNPSGTELVYSTYLGGGDSDQAYGIAVDGSENAYVTGYTSSSDFPTTPGAFQTTFAGYQDAFMTKLTPNGTTVLYSTYLRGQATSVALGIGVDWSGNPYLTGWTQSTDFPTTPGAFQTTFGGGGGTTSFISALNLSGRLSTPTPLGTAVAQVFLPTIFDSRPCGGS